MLFYYIMGGNFLMIDTHCHLLKEYYHNLDDTFNELKKNKINAVIVNGCDKDSNNEVLEIVKKYDMAYGAIGFHPTELENIEDDDLKWLEDNLQKDKIVAIGEIGLDYHYENTNKEKQKYFFKKQLLLAQKYDKPVIIHSRDAILDTYNILSSIKVRGVLHCYSGSLEMAKEFTKIGYFLGIGGIITFKNAKNIIEVIKNIDSKYILLETDSPYLSPEPYRGQINTPVYLKYILEKISEIKNVDFKEMERITNLNARRLFDFK